MNWIDSHLSCRIVALHVATLVSLGSASDDNDVTGVEFDVWLSSHGFPVCHHDLSVDRTTNGTGLTRTRRWRQLSHSTRDPGSEAASTRERPFPDSKRAATMLSASIKINVLPIESTATVNFRLHPRDRVESVTDYVKSVVENGRIEVRVAPGGLGRAASSVSEWRSVGV